MKPLLDELAGAHHRWSDIELRDRADVIASIGFLGPALRHVPADLGMSYERFVSIFADFIINGLRPRDDSSRGKQGDVR